MMKRLQRMKGELKFALEESGEQYVIPCGTIMMHRLYADSLDWELQVNNFQIILYLWINAGPE